MLLAIVLSIIILVGYEYFFMPKPNPALNEFNSTKKELSAQSGNKAPQAIENEIQKNAQASTTPDISQNQPARKIIATINSKHYTAFIDDLGRIAQFSVNDKRFKNEKGEVLKLFNETKEPKALEIRFKDAALNREAFKTPYVSDTKEIEINGKSRTITLTQKLSSLTVTKKITFYPSGNYEIDISLTKPETFFITPGGRPDVIADAYTVHGVLIRNPDGSLKIVEDGDCDKTEVIKNATIVSAFDRYYTTAFYDFDKGLTAIVSPLDNEQNPMVFIQLSQSSKLKGFVGPKDHRLLESIDPRLTDIIEYGFFTFIAKPMFKLLQFLYELIGNWGWAIVVITILIRVVLFPLTLKGMISMSKMKELAPKMKELQAKYKDDKAKLNAKMMELYKKHGANPMGGCLPMLLQIPVFFAIYRVLLNAIELKGAPWILWITDLSVKDPYFVLPILMGATMYWNQKITPMTTTDPTQEKIMKFLPLIFTFFFVTFPAGLTLYWFVNNLLSVAQQYYVNYYLDKRKKLQKAEA